MIRPHLRRAVLAAAVATGFAVIGAVPAAASTAPDASAAPDADPYCGAHLALEAALATEDPAQIDPAVEALQAAAPPELADAVQTVLDNADSSPTDPVFAEAYGQLADYLVGSCGFMAVDVLATEYAFAGIPEELPAGPTVFSLTAGGEEAHELVLVRRNDGVTDSVADLLTMPEEELFSKITFVGITFAVPEGAPGRLVADLPPGEYIAVCTFPVGTTPEVFQQMMAEGPTDSGAPASGPADTMAMGSEAPAGTEPSIHAAEGMVFEFTVVDGAATPATTG
jgi:hypothetical protein